MSSINGSTLDSVLLETTTHEPVFIKDFFEDHIGYTSFCFCGWSTAQGVSSSSLQWATHPVPSGRWVSSLRSIPSEVSECSGSNIPVWVYSSLIFHTLDGWDCLDYLWGVLSL